MEFRAYSCGVPSQTVRCGLLPLLSQTARRVSTSTCRAGLGRMVRCIAVRGSSGDDDEFGSRRWSMVDADMIVLRKRMYQLKQQENNYEYPQKWMEWEKKWHRKYHSDVFRALECLQFNLINTRPRVVIALLSLVGASVSASVVLVLSTGITYLMALLSNGKL